MTDIIIKQPSELIKENLIVKHYAGSISYGTNTPTSDVDFRGIFVANPVNLRTPFFPISEVNDSSEEDTVIYELNHYMKLALDCNPNIIESLWVDELDITYRTPAYDMLRAAAPQLLSSKIAFTTSGYAMSQLNRMKQSKKKVTYLPYLDELCVLLQKALADKQIDSSFIHRECGPDVMTFLENKFDNLSSGGDVCSSLDELFKYFNLESNSTKQRIKVVCKPQQKNFVSMVQWFGRDKLLSRDFSLDQFKKNHRLIPYGNDTYGIYAIPNYELYDFIGNLNTTYEGDRSELAVPLCVVKFNKEEYLRVKDEYDKFWEWRKNRNATRLAMEEEFFFDGKHAMHLVRLLRMGVEALTTGEIIVKRPDAKELLSIRNGDWTYDELIKYADGIDNTIKNTLYHTTKLRKTPDIKFAAELMMRVQDITWEMSK